MHARTVQVKPNPRLLVFHAYLLLENRREHRVDILFDPGNDERLPFHHAVLERVPEFVVCERHHPCGGQPVLLVPAYPAERLPLRVYQ